MQQGTPMSLRHTTQLQNFIYTYFVSIYCVSSLSSSIYSSPHYYISTKIYIAHNLLRSSHSTQTPNICLYKDTDFLKELCFFFCTACSRGYKISGFLLRGRLLVDSCLKYASFLYFHTSVVAAGMTHTQTHLWVFFSWGEFLNHIDLLHFRLFFFFSVSIFVSVVLLLVSCWLAAAESCVSVLLVLGVFF